MTLTCRKLLSLGAFLLVHISWATSSDMAASAETSYVPESEKAAKAGLQSVPCDPVNPAMISYIDCKGLDDGVYQDPNTKNCSEYFKCEKQQRINCSCGPELIFDVSLQSCSVGNQTPPCPHLSIFKGGCTDKPDGLYPISGTGCKRYYMCANGFRIDFRCPEGQLFAVGQATCVEEGAAPNCAADEDRLSEESQETDVMQSDSPSTDCAGKPDGKYVLSHSKGTRFQVCKSGYRLKEGTCEPGETFSQSHQACVPSTSTIQAVSPPTVATDPCSGMADGYYPNVSRHCSTYFFCLDYKLQSEVTCPDGTQFEPVTELCLSSSVVSCEGSSVTHTAKISAECLGKKDGYYPVLATKCKEFYQCRNQRNTSRNRCHDGEAFDSQLQECISDDFVMCNGTLLDKPSTARDRDPFCFRKPDGYYPDYSKNCRTFYYCKNKHKTVELVCEDGEGFDPENKTCQHYSSILCRPPESATPAPSPTRVPNVTQDPCSGKADGYYGDPSTECRHYYFCRSGRTNMNLTCDRSQAFDDDAKKCLPTSQVHCQSGDSWSTSPHWRRPLKNICQNKQDGFYPNYGSGCLEYYHCRKGHNVTEYVCTSDQLFDPVTSQCRPEKQVDCVDRVDGCSFKQDGYYPTREAGCRSYYYCRNQIKIVDVGCPSGQIFDTDEGQCLDEMVATCENETTTNECQGRADGYYRDYATNCSAYFQCHKRTKVRNFQCPSGTCFMETSGLCIKPLRMEHRCRGLPDGYYMDRVYSCQKYYLCNASQLELQACPENMVFDLADFTCKAHKSLKYCKHIWNFSCIGRKDGIHEYTVGNKKTLHVCQRGSHIQAGSAIVVQPGKVRYKVDVMDDPGSAILFDCRQLVDGFHPENVNGNCSRYHLCLNGRLVRTAHCPTGQQFHIHQQKCRPWDEVLCGPEPAVKSPPLLEPTVKSPASPPLRSPASKSVSFHFHFQNGCSNVTLCFKTRLSFLTQCPQASVSSSEEGAKKYCKIGNIAEIQSKSADDRYSGRHDVLPTFDCRRKEDGYYTDPASECRKWHMCDSGRGYTYECETGKAFNILHKRCDESELVTCVEESWVYRNYSSARSLPSSFRSQMQDFRKQPSMPDHNPECYGRSDGIYVDITDTTDTCFRVYLCINKQLYGISCPFEEKPVQDEEGVTCKVKDDVKCMKGDGINARINPPVSSDPQRALNDTCVNQDDGFYVDVVGGCQSFYVCRRGAINVYQCPDSLLFNSETKTCDLPENVVCLIQATNVLRCPKHLTKLYPDHDSDCTSYFGCSNGSFRYSTCPQGSLFDFRTSECVPRSTAVCVNAVVLAEGDPVSAQASTLVGRRLATPGPHKTTQAPISQSSFNCNGRPDGFYPDHEQHCHVFYRCVHGKKYSHYCQTGQLFSSRLQSCDFQENVQCHEQKFVRASNRK